MRSTAGSVARSAVSGGHAGPGWFPLAAASGGAGTVATAAAVGVKAGGVADDARRLTRAAVHARLALPAGPTPASGPTRDPIALPAGRLSPGQPQ
ncbi:MAG: hypothetical protein WCG47_19630, partial [Dermatophilaceae bacterium]